MKISEDQVNAWVDSAVPNANSAKNYKTRIKPFVKDSDNIVPKLRNLDILKAINERYTAPSTVKGIIQVFLKLIAEYPGLKEAVGEKVYDTYNKAFAEANGAMSTQYIQKSIVKDEEDAIPSFSSLKKMIYNSFPAGSDERLFVDLYEVAPVRDDFGKLYIVQTIPETKDKTKNYYVLSRHTIILNDYKKGTRYGQLRYKVPKALQKRIDTSKETIFDHGETLTSWVGKMLKSIGVSGAVNTFRHAYLSEALDGEGIKDPEVRKELFTKMAHSPSTQLQYLRALKE
jgi:hypothetical protein